MLYSDRFRVTETGSDVRWGPVPWYGPTVPRWEPPTTVTRTGYTESDFYSRKVIKALMVAEGDIRDLDMCAICAGTSHDALGGKVDPTLETIYGIVLPICTICKKQGAKTLVGRYCSNGRAIEKRLDQTRRAEAAAAVAAATDER